MRSLDELAVREPCLRALLGAVDAAMVAMRRARPVPQSIRSLLLLRRRSLGDLILLLPALRRAQALFPGARITLMTDAAYAPFLREADLGLEVWAVRSWTAIAGAAPAGFDAALAFHAHPAILLAGRRHARWLAGYATPGSRCLLDCVLPDRSGQEAARRWQTLVTGLAQHLSPAAAPPAALSTVPHLPLVPAWRAAAAALWPVPQAAPVIVHPGCGTPSKRWEAARWAGLIARCRAQGWPVLVTGSAQEAPECLALVAGSHDPEVRSVAGRSSLGALAGLVAAARAVVAPDTGIIHLARALGTPTVALFGPNSPAIWGAAGWGGGDGRQRSLAHPLACSYCALARCPRLPRHAAASPCMQAISLESVWRALAAAISSDIHRRMQPCGGSGTLLHSARAKVLRPAPRPMLQ